MWVVFCSEWVDVGGCSSVGSMVVVFKLYFGVWLRWGIGLIIFFKDLKRCVRGVNDVLEGCFVLFV